MRNVHTHYAKTHYAIEQPSLTLDHAHFVVDDANIVLMNIHELIIYTGEPSATLLLNHTYFGISLLIFRTHGL